MQARGQRPAERSQLQGAGTGVNLTLTKRRGSVCAKEASLCPVRRLA